jgi:hypothetical protein
VSALLLFWKGVEFLVSVHWLRSSFQALITSTPQIHNAIPLSVTHRREKACQANHPYFCPLLGLRHAKQVCNVRSLIVKDGRITVHPDPPCHEHDHQKVPFCTVSGVERMAWCLNSMKCSPTIGGGWIHETTSSPARRWVMLSSDRSQRIQVGGCCSHYLASLSAAQQRSWQVKQIKNFTSGGAQGFELISMTSIQLLPEMEVVTRLGRVPGVTIQGKMRLSRVTVSCTAWTIS